MIGSVRKPQGPLRPMMNMAAVPDGKGSLSIGDLADRLERLIVLGELVPRERLVEIDLAERFGVPRGRVREALKILSAKGVVVSTPGRGAMVASYSARETRELLRVRCILEVAAAEMAAEKARPADIKELRGRARRFSDAASRGDLPELRQRNEEFHGYITELAGNEALASLIHQLKLKTYFVRHIGWLTGERLKASAAEHDAIVDALERREREAIVGAFEQHLVLSREPFLPKKPIEDEDQPATSSGARVATR